VAQAGDLGIAAQRGPALHGGPRVGCATVRLLVTTVSFGVLILGVIIELLRRRRLREKYAALWLFTGCLVIMLALFPGGLDVVASSYRHGTRKPR
jgi:multisubunit Na+/H+ antiporter MnhB subunit